MLTSILHQNYAVEQLRLEIKVKIKLYLLITPRFQKMQFMKTKFCSTENNIQKKTTPRLKLIFYKDLSVQKAESKLQECLGLSYWVPLLASLEDQWCIDYVSIAELKILRGTFSQNECTGVVWKLLFMTH